MMTKYVISLDDEYFDGEEYDTREEAVKSGLQEAQKYNADNDYDVGSIFGYDPDGVIHQFYVGREALTDMNYETAADDVLDEVQDSVSAQLGEFAEGYLDDVTEEDRKDLANVIEDWFKRHNYFPHGFVVEDTEEYQVPTDDGESND